MKTFVADILYPVDQDPILNGYVTVNEQGQIIEIGQSNESMRETAQVISGAICPGMINTHCHLELSFMYEKIPTHTGLIDFIGHVVRLRDLFTKEEEQQAIQRAENEMYENGIVAVGDISNDTRSFAVKSKSKLRFHTFVEVFDFRPEVTLDFVHKGIDVFNQVPQINESTASITPHAPYSCTPTLVNFCDRFSSMYTPLLSIHNQEHPEENQYFIDKTGSWVQLFIDWGENQDWFVPAGKTSMQAMGEYLSKRNQILYVHNTFTAAQDVAWAKEHLKEVYYASCPNANLYIENRLPNYKELIQAGAKITLGTDSLASNWQLSILEEMKTVQNHFPEFSTQQLLEWACLHGAKALLFDDKLGSLSVGKTPGILHLTQLGENFSLTADTRVERLV